MPRSRRTLTLIVLLMTMAGPAFAAWTRDWASIRAAATDVRTLQADFVQTKHLKMLKAPIVSRGRFYYRSTGELRWEYTSPVRSVTILDRQGLRRYAWRGGKPVRDSSARLQPLQSVLGEMNLWLQGDFRQSRVFAAELVTGPPALVRLQPRDQALKKFVSAIELGLSTTPGVVDAIEIIEGPAARTRIELSRVVRNQPLADRVFSEPK